MHIRFDAIVSADAFENLKPAPDIFLAASKNLNVPQSEVYYFALSDKPNHIPSSLDQDRILCSIYTFLNV